jgi:hypothetical protein
VFEANKALDAALKASKTRAELDAQQAEDHYTRAIPVQSVKQVDEFGQLLNSNKRKRIDDWLSNEDQSPKYLKSEASSERSAQLNVSEQSGAMTVGELAEGFHRLKIDDYIQHTREAWENTESPGMGIRFLTPSVQSRDSTISLEAASVD